MPRVLKIAFKHVTAAEFLAINIASKGSSSVGGGQSYIDFQASEVSEASWSGFFDGIATAKISPKGWLFSVRSLGTTSPAQEGVELSYRDAPKFTRFGLRSQKLPSISSQGRRLFAWRPELTGFPALPPGVTTQPQLPAHLVAQLRIFLIRDDEDRIWAGWHNGPPPIDLPPALAPMFATNQGMIEISGGLELDPVNADWPFALPGAVIDADDSALWDNSDELDAPETGITYSLQTIRQRNKAAANAVRKLYDGCQLTGNEFAFATRTGRPYLEVHHLIPLGKGGADAPHNMVVVSAHMHKMLHHADVSAIDLTQIVDGKLAVTINGESYSITWHPQHAAVVQQHHSAS